MANEDTSSNKHTSGNNNLKVPPIKIVLGSHQSNNAVVNIASCSEEEQSEAGDTDSQSFTVDRRPEHKKFSHRNNSNNSNAGDTNQIETIERHTRRHNRFSGIIDDTGEGGPSSGGRASSSSDRSASSTPSSESESIASNSTIISDHNLSQQQQTRSNRLGIKDDGSSTSTSTSGSGRQEQRTFRSKGQHSRTSFVNERAPSNSISGKKSQEASSEQNSETSNTKEHAPNSNQRITRSSQRAAQQVKVDGVANESNGADEVNDNQDKTNTDSSRKVKRRKGDVQEAGQEASQAPIPQPPPMANICPADYQLPSQNSFQLYRDVRNRPLKKLKKLVSVQPRTPQGFKDYLISSGPYLLDGNKLGLGLTGARFDKLSIGVSQPTVSYPNRKRNSMIPATSKAPTLLEQRHTTYSIPKVATPPSKLDHGSQLYKLFQDQETARNQMRIQHLKERERLILTFEQEIMRTYTRAAIADKKQKKHLSACTYLYYQERYHYLEDKTKKPSPICNTKHPEHGVNDNGESSLTNPVREVSSIKDSKDNHPNLIQTKDPTPGTDPITYNDAMQNASGQLEKDNLQSRSVVESTKEDFEIAVESSDVVETGPDEAEKPGPNLAEPDRDVIESNTETTEEEFKAFNQDQFLHQLQEVDEKWENIKKNMLARHKNEADSLFAVQSMEWEWRAKELGLCDIRVPFEVDSDLVPKVEVDALDY